MDKYRYLTLVKAEGLRRRRHRDVLHHERHRLSRAAGEHQLAALPGLCGATLRIFYSFAVPIFGGRRFTALSTARARAALAVALLTASLISSSTSLTTRLNNSFWVNVREG